jgi:hypothetical protein
MPVICSFCGRQVDRHEDHHLIPRMKHNKRMKRLHTKVELKQKVHSCIPCHDHLHALFTEKELAEIYNTVATLMAHPDMRNFVSWISSKPADFVVHSKRASRRR